MTQRLRRLDGRRAVLFFILVLLAVIMAGVAFFDYQWTLALNANKAKALADFMSRTLFEGEGFGGSDPAILFLILALLAYLSAWEVVPLKRFKTWRPWLGFIIGTAPIVGLCIIHSLKWVMGRARPREVLRQGLDYSQWYEIGPHYITEGIYRGSFPSGHTASTLLLLTVAYLLAADRNNRRVSRLVGWCWGAAVLAYCLVMAVSRSMTMSHWIADSLFTILAGWLVIHCLYFWVFRVTEQTAFFRNTHELPRLPRLWELRLGGYLFLVTFGLTLTGLGVRAYMEQSIPWLAALIVPGLILAIWFGHLASRLYRTVRVALNPTERSC